MKRLIAILILFVGITLPSVIFANNGNPGDVPIFQTYPVVHDNVSINSNGNPGDVPIFQ